MKSDAQKCQNKVKPIKEWCIKTTKLQFQWILNTEHLMLQNASNEPKWTVKLGYMCPSCTFWSTSSDTHQVVEIQKETLTKMFTPF